MIKGIENITLAAQTAAKLMQRGAEVGNDRRVLAGCVLIKSHLDWVDRHATKKEVDDEFLMAYCVARKAIDKDIPLILSRRDPHRQDLLFLAGLAIGSAFKIMASPRTPETFAEELASYVSIRYYRIEITLLGGGDLTPNSVDILVECIEIVKSVESWIEEDESE